MKVFVGWSGTRSQALALALREWLPLVLHYVDPWLSETDIAAGERWAEAVAKELEASNFGILCVTRENLTSPWIIFEAGSLAKSLQSSKVIPLLLDLEFSEISGPLAQFQAKKVDEEGLSEVIHSINRAATQPVQEVRAKQLFEALWPELEKKLEAMPEQDQPAKPIRTQHQILEELVAGVRSLESRLRELPEMVLSQRGGRLRRFGRFDPMIVHELLHVIGAKPHDPVILLVFASLIREELPWMYELAMETHRVATTGGPNEAREAIDRLRRTIDFTLHGPFLEEVTGDPRAAHIMLRQLQHFFGIEPTVEEEPPTRSRRRKEVKDE